MFKPQSLVKVQSRSCEGECARVADAVDVKLSGVCCVITAAFSEILGLVNDAICGMQDVFASEHIVVCVVYRPKARLVRLRY